MKYLWKVREEIPNSGCLQGKTEKLGNSGRRKNNYFPLHISTLL